MLVMNTARQIVFISFISIASWQDAKRKEVGIWVYGLFGSLAWYINLCLLHLQDWQAILLSISLGPGLLFLSRMTCGAIGEGDGLFFLVTGIFLGFQRNILLFSISVMLCGVFTMGIFLWGKIKNISVSGKTVPFLPFAFPVGIWITFL